MNATELLSNLRALGPQDANVFFQYLADHFYEFRSRSGYRLWEAEDVKTFFEEIVALANVAAFSQSTEVLQTREIGTRPLVIITASKPPAPQPRYDATCPRCGHVHEGDRECGAFLGGGRFCRCELEVPA